MAFDNYNQFFNSNLRVYIDIKDTDNCGKKKREKEVKKEEEKRASFSSQHHLIFKISSTPNMCIDFISSYPEYYMCDD